MISQSLLNEAEQLTRDIAPELFADGQRVYFVDRQTLEGIPHGKSCFAEVLIGRGALTLDAIDRIADWTRVGPIISLNPELIAEGYGYGDDFRAGFLNTVVHEIGHCLPRVEYPDRERFDSHVELCDVPEVREFQRDRLAAETEQTTHYDSHDMHFARRAIHLYFRARVAGWNVPIGGLLNGVIPLTHPIWFLDSLLAECDELRDSSFSEIEATDAPEFNEHWNESIEHRRRLLPYSSNNPEANNDPTQ